MQSNNIKIKKGYVLDNLEITDLAFGGEGIAKLATEQGDYILFVKNNRKGP